MNNTIWNIIPRYITKELKYHAFCIMSFLKVVVRLQTVFYGPKRLNLDRLF